MGSYRETAAVRKLPKKYDEKVGVIAAHSYRPFPVLELLSALQKLETSSVVERTDDSSVSGSPEAKSAPASVV